MALAGNPSGVPGEDGYHRALLKRHLDAEDAAEAWEERVQERAEELRAKDNELGQEEAELVAGEQLHQEDIEARERYWDSVAYERGMG